MKKNYWSSRVDELMQMNVPRCGKKISSRGKLSAELETLAFFSRKADTCAVLLLMGGLILAILHPACVQAQQMGSPQEDLRDIQGIIPLAGLEWWVYAAGVLSMVILGLIIFLLKRKNAARPEIESPETVAFRELEAARQSLQEGMAREFSLSVSEVLRRYIEVRFGIPVVQRTTEEFLVDMRKSGLVGVVSHLEELDVFLKLCDQAKFGREPLTLSEMEVMWSSARNFVDQTGLSMALGQDSLLKKEAVASEPQAV